MKILFKYIVLLLFFSLSALVYGQAISAEQFTGIVINQKKEIIAGAQIISNKSKKRTVSDKNGAFSLDILDTELIIVSAQGYHSSIAKLETNTDTIVLHEDGSQHQDANYKLSQATLPFERITGSVERITGKELADYPSLYLEEALAGRLSGLTSQYGSTNPISERSSLQLRGAHLSTFVDGAPARLTETTDEVEEIIIAKDYASSLMFGGLSDNGALLMNTKRGKEGEKLIKFTANTGVRNPTYIEEMMDAAQYATYLNKALANEGRAPYYSKDEIEGYAAGNDKVRYPNNDYVEDLVSDPSYYNHVTGDFAGGNQFANYYSHVGVYNTNGIESTSNQSQYTRLRTKNNVEMYLSDYATVEVGVAASYSTQTGPTFNADNVFDLYDDYPANAFPYIIVDSLHGTARDYSINPLGKLTHSREYDRTLRDVNSRIAMNLDLENITEGLRFKALYNYYAFDQLEKYNDPSFYKAERYYIPNGASDTMILLNQTKGADDPDWHRGNCYTYRAQYLKGALNYNRTFSPDHSLIASLQVNNTSYSGSGMSVDEIYRNIGASANYMLMKQWVLDANVMKTYSRSQLKEEANKLNYAFGAAWLLHKTSLFKDSDVLDFLKLRANYGENTQPVSLYYLKGNLYGSANAGRFGTLEEQSSSSGNIRSFTASPDLEYPRQSYLNVGLDFSLWEGVISGQANYFSIHKLNAVTQAENRHAIIANNKSYLTYINYGDVERSGYDARLRYSDSHNDFRWTVDANVLYNTTYVHEDNSLDLPQSVRSSIGNYNDRILGLDFDGVFASQEEIEAAPTHLFSPVGIGDARYKDYEEDGVINEKDYHEIGHASRISYGLNLALSYKGFTLSAHADGKLGGSYLEDRFLNTGTNTYTAGMASIMDDPTMPRVTTMSIANNNVNSSLWLRDAGYLNLRSVNLYYALPAQWLLKTPIKAASLHLSGKNLLVLSENDDTYMPLRGAGYNMHPVLNAYELGIDIQF